MKIGITLGDINGIGPEIIIKTFSDSRILKYVTPVIYGSFKALSYHKNIVKESNINFHSVQSAKNAIPGKVNLVNCWEENINITLGKPTEESGKYAYISIDRAFSEVKDGLLDGIVTAPIHKNAMKMANFPFVGHTEYFTQNDSKNQSLMLMVADTVRVGLVTNHLPISEVSSALRKELIIEKAKILNRTLIEDFGYERPLIGVLGLNPHASDDSLIGDEEERIIKPALIELKKQGMFVTGPHPADGWFGSGAWEKYDGILAMYHDQGLVPFKLLSFGSGTNVTAGLSFVRTSPDHGTAYDIAGQNQADESSFKTAVLMAVELVKNRKEYHDSRANALVRREKQSAGLND